MNFLTVDVEDWYHANVLHIPFEQWEKCENRVVTNTEKLLDLFDQKQLKATFFVLGYIAEKEPHLINEIVRRGHEVASHGYYHQLVYHLSDNEFREDVRRSKAVIEDAAGKEVLFYRAPSWSISLKNIHRLQILAEEGYRGDSSLQPFWTPLSGSLRIPTAPFYPVINGVKLPLLEVPPTVLKITFLRIPFLGGFYLRAIPVRLIKWALKMLETQRDGVLYVHPWEIDEKEQDIKVKGLAKFIHLYNLSTTYSKLDVLLSDYEFSPISTGFEIGNYPSIKLC